MLRIEGQTLQSNMQWNQVFNTIPSTQISHNKCSQLTKPRGFPISGETSRAFNEIQSFWFRVQVSARIQSTKTEGEKRERTTNDLLWAVSENVYVNVQCTEYRVCVCVYAKSRLRVLNVDCLYDFDVQIINFVILHSSNPFNMHKNDASYFIIITTSGPRSRTGDGRI